MLSLIKESSAVLLLTTIVFPAPASLVLWLNFYRRGTCKQALSNATNGGNTALQAKILCLSAFSSQQTITVLPELGAVKQGIISPFLLKTKYSPFNSAFRLSIDITLISQLACRSPPSLDTSKLCHWRYVGISTAHKWKKLWSSCKAKYVSFQNLA